MKGYNIFYNQNNEGGRRPYEEEKMPKTWDDVCQDSAEFTQKVEKWAEDSRKSRELIGPSKPRF